MIDNGNQQPRKRGRQKKNKQLEPPDLPDENRCWACFHGEQCALDIGHYRSNLDQNPSPHITEAGVEWFGNRNSEKDPRDLERVT